MPELPDVEAVIKRIRGDLLGRPIKGVTILDGSLASGRELGPLKGKDIEGVTRRGKYILLSLSSGTTLVIHLRMTGNLVVADTGSPRPPHTRLILHLDNGKDLVFTDPRRLGELRVVKDRDPEGVPGLQRMGPEPLSEDFTLGAFRDRLRKRTATIKSLLMNQHFIAGIGNIYGDEILFQSRINPLRKASDLTTEETGRLYRKIRSVLRHACGHDADLTGMGNWFVQGRSRGYCVKCKGRLKRVKIRGRYSYFCPRCQR